VRRLREADYRQVLAFLREADAVEGADPFPVPLLQSLTRLIPCEVANFCELDEEARRVLSNTDSDGAVYTYDPGTDWIELWRLMDLLPTCAHHQATGSFHAVKVSDFMTRRQLLDSELYEWRFRPLGTLDELEAGISSSRRYTKNFLFHAGREFDERDRLVLDLLRPHLASFYRRAAERRRAAAALAALEAAAPETVGVVVVGPTGGVELVSAAAARLAADFVGEPLGDYLSEPIASWLLHQTTRLNGSERLPDAAEPLTIHRGDRRLVVRAATTRILLFEEQRVDPRPTRESLGLTRREWEVLTSLARGLSNVEIGRLLWVSPGTVRKHLEHIYAKLGVNGRTGAVAQAFLSAASTGEAAVPPEREGGGARR